MVSVPPEGWPPRGGAWPAVGAREVPAHRSLTIFSGHSCTLDLLAVILAARLHISLVAQTVKRLPTMRETQVPSLGREDPLEKEMAIHSSTLAWKIPRMAERGRLQPMGSQRVGHD